MSETALQADLTWTMFQAEDRRFRWILAQTLAVSLLLGVVAARFSLPQPDTTLERELPPRRVTLLAAQTPAQTKPAASPTTPRVDVPPAAQAPAPAAPVKAAPSARETAQSSGVLAMGDALSELQAMAPSADAGRGRTDNSPPVDRVRGQSSALSSDLTSGSGGVAPGVAHQSVLGEASLPQREGRRAASSAGSGSAERQQRYSSTSTGAVRGEEQIQEVLDRNKGAMFTLYNRELRSNPGLQGRLVLSITVSAAGKVTQCVIVSSELESKSLEQQLVALVMNIDFGSLPDVPAATTRIPIEFFPR